MMILYYIKYGNYYPEEFITGYFLTEEVAEEVCNFLNNGDCSMHEVTCMHTDNYYETFADWKKEWEI